MLRIQSSCAVLFVSLIIGVGTASAQSQRVSTQTPQQSVPQPAGPASLWTAADTGRMMPGDQTFTRHTPGMCIAAMESVRRAVWRRREWDTAARGKPGLDTLPTTAIQTGRTCAAQFDESDTSDVHLRDLMRLRTSLGDRTGARAATDKRLSRVSTDTARGTILFEVVKAELRTSPVHMPSVYAALARVDSIGDGAVAARLLAHTEVADYLLNSPFDTAAIKREARAIFALRPLVTPADMDMFVRAAGRVYVREWYLAWYRVQDSTLAFVIDSVTQYGIRDIGALLDGQVGDNLQKWGQILAPFAGIVGMPAPPLTGAYWYNKPKGVTYPEPGKVTLLYEINNDIRNKNIYVERLERFRRMQEKYGSKGFQVVLLAKTNGASWESPKQSPIDEANTIAWFALEQLRLPFPLLVDTTSMGTGQTEPRTEYERAYSGTRGRALVGRDGKIRTVTIGTGESDAMFEAFIVQALEKK